MSGTCKPNEQEKRASEPLSIAQFLSAFLLLAIGMGISMILLLLEHFYMRYLQSHVTKTNENGCCALISQVWFIKDYYIAPDSRFSLALTSCLKLGLDGAVKIL